MNRYFSSLFATVLVSLSFLVSTYAADVGTLSINSVKVIDNKDIRVTFSEAIDADSVVLKIMKQSDNSTIKTAGITVVADMPEAVDVSLDDELTEASSYTLTVIAAIGKSGTTVVDGAAALQDFVTPSPLKIAGEVALNAPSNPNAVMSTDTPKTTTSIEAPSPTIQTPKVIEPTPTEELPLTGPSTYLFLIVALLGSYFLLRRKVA